jgi:hypothetical protein
MPSPDNETLLLSKKQKKNKKNKLKTTEDEEEVVAEAEEVTEENGHENGAEAEEASPKKNKKNKKNKAAAKQEEAAVEEEETEAAPVHNDEATEEEEEMQISQGNKKTSEPSTYEMDHSKVNEVVKELNDVNTELIEQFRSVAQKVVKKHSDDPVAPLAAAIAVLAGATKVVTKSLLTQREVCCI